MRIVKDEVRVRVPATSANLGPGFDSFGISHDIWDDVTLKLITGPSRVFILGQGAQTLPKDENHLIVQVVQQTLERLGLPTSGIELKCRNEIAQGRGLGSSAAAIVAGLMLVKALVDEQDLLTPELLLEWATEWEGHPDNAAPAIFGGATLAWMNAEKPQVANLNLHPDLKTTLLIPNFELSTKTARGVLPTQIAYKDAIFNVSRAGLLVHALANDLDLLFSATEDCLHQPYRLEALGRSGELLTALRNANWPAVVSGAGPSLLLFAQIDEKVKKIFKQQGFVAVSSQPGKGAQILDA
ncbi:MAG: homoserine kinase [Arcanobacterium sp.]|nr:homoserine kinase [Arcanobacterium sp.]